LKALRFASTSLAALLAAGCASSRWAKVENVPGGKLYVPKVYAPLLPGSIYPDRKVPVPARSRPVLVLVCPEKGDCRKDEVLDQAAQRGFVVLTGREPKVDLLRTRPEAAGAPTGWLLISPTEEFLRKDMGPAGAAPAAVAILQGRAPDATALPSLSSLSKKIFSGVPRRVMRGALLGSEADAPSAGVIEKLYASDPAGRLPREAYRDAVEWLAGELGAR
jgi:hypothetical protein